MNDDDESTSECLKESDKHQAGSFTQYKSLIIRNLLIKKSEKQKTITEFVMPLYCIAILAIIRLFVKDNIYPPVTWVHDGAYLYTTSSELSNGKMLVTPDSDEVKLVVQELGNSLDMSPDVIEYFTSEVELINYYNENKENVSVGLVFLDTDPVRNSSYVIRINPVNEYLVSPSTRETSGSECRENVSDGLQKGSPSCQTNSYYTSGFLSLQLALDLVIMNMQSEGKRVNAPKIYLESFPLNEYTSGGTVALRSIVPLYMVFAWAQFIIYMMILIVEEKEKKIKEGMKMMGLRGSVYWFSWLTIYFCYVVILAIICIIVLPLAKVFKKANLFLLFILFVLYGLSSIILALMLTPFFNDAKVAGIVGQLSQIFMSLLFYLQVYLSDRISAVAFWFLALLSPCAFSLAIDKAILFDYSTDSGLDWDNIWEGEGLPYAGSLIMISVDIVLYLLLAFYFDKVIPSEYGTKLKPWFIFQKSTYIKNKNVRAYSASSGHKNESFENMDNIYADEADTEPFPVEWKGREAVRIRNLHKIFKSRGNDDVHAVNGLSMDIYEGQITAILGHNGAGKTTLFNMLTGLISVSSGTATIFNYDVRNQNDLAEIRKLTGVCPQHDILFLTLTPREHLTFYAVIKGIPESLVKSKVNDMLQETDLLLKADTKADDLSGGQKRKLSIGIALIGDPKIVFLDEPTAGVDAYSRRHLWSLLKKNKHGKVILLTTHFMDEADVLADRKAIVSKGKLRCYGTSMFLKNRFGIGYHLTLVISDSDNAVKSIETQIKNVIPDADIVRHYGKELSFILPSTSSHLFTKLFRTLDESMEDAGVVSDIESYGISMTTLEEVFLALNDETENDREIGSVENIGRDLLRNRSPSSGSIKLSKDSACANNVAVQDENENPQQSPADSEHFDLDDVVVEKNRWRAFKALVKLRVLNVVREIASVIFLIFFPLGFVVGSIALADGISVEIGNDDQLLLSTELYKSSVNDVFIYNGTRKDLSPLESLLRYYNLAPELYNGEYNFIYENQSHFSAFDVQGLNNDGFIDIRLRYNSTFAHILPILVNIVNNAYMSYINGSSQIITYSQQLPLLESGSSEFDFSAYFSPVMIGFVFTLIPCGLVIDIVYDREMNGQNILRLNGVGFNMYFGSFFLVIGILYFISYVGLLIIIEAFQVPSLSDGPAFACVAILYLLYMPSALLFSCCVSYVFDKQDTARQFYPSIATTLGFAFYTIVALVDIYEGSETSFPLHIVFTVFVSYYIPFGVLYYVNKVYVVSSISNDTANLTMSDYMTKEIVAMFVVCIADIFLYYILLRIIYSLKFGGDLRDALWMKKKDSSVDPFDQNEASPTLNHVDDDVEEERKKILTKVSASEVTSTALIFNLSKTYGKSSFSREKCKKGKKAESKEVAALTNVSFEVVPGQVFGLLGPNGAGKTSLIRIMNAEEGPTKGKVFICGYDITSSLSEAYQYLGYCPQFDCYWKNLKVDEHIECFANISGVREDQVQRLVNKYVKGLEIEEHRDKKSKDCSGGTKRKLSYILSMMGRPKIVLLDEPSTGMDPQSKRFLWNSILSSFKGDRCALLTTHSMEEADALCSRIGILVKGELRCLGSVQHLKNKYGSGYNLELKLQKRSPLSNSQSFKDAFEVDNEFISSNMASLDLRNFVKSLVKRNFPNSLVDEEFEERINFKIPQKDIRSLAEIFSLLEKLKTQKIVEEYALSQTTLEQVFLRFARLQEEEEEEEEKGGGGKDE